MIPVGRALLYAEPIYLQAERSPMPELRLVVLALQDRLAYGPTFEVGDGGAVRQRPVDAGDSTERAGASAIDRSRPVCRVAAPSASAAAPAATDTNGLISAAAKDLADYQRLTAEGKLGEAGQKLEALKQKLEALNRQRR